MCKDQFPLWVCPQQLRWAPQCNPRADHCCLSRLWTANQPSCPPSGCLKGVSCLRRFLLAEGSVSDSHHLGRVGAPSTAAVLGVPTTAPPAPGRARLRAEGSEPAWSGDSPSTHTQTQLLVQRNSFPSPGVRNFRNQPPTLGNVLKHNTGGHGGGGAGMQSPP